MLDELNRRYSHFGGRPDEYPKYLNRADVEDYFLFVFDGEEFGSAACLAVGRRKDMMQRKIWAVVLLNFGWRRPEDVLPAKFLNRGMIGPAAFSLMTPCRWRGLHWGSMDISQAFTAVLY